MVRPSWVRVMGVVLLALAHRTATGAAQLVPVDLCDCHYATASDGSSTSLSCERDGFFIAGFRGAGYLSGRMEELLPLSPAICCRPCLSNATMQQGAVLAVDRPVAVVTGSCRSASVSDGERCSGDTKSGFLQGFQDGQIGTPVSYYPYGPAQCCTPTVLLQSGNVLPLQRCECLDDARSPTHISCGAADAPESAAADGRLIWGFDHVHDIYGHFPVPAAHSQCCKVCVDVAAAARPAEHCEDLNNCNRRGQCVFGQCQCAGGYSGESCSIAPHKKGDGIHLPMSVILLFASLLFCCFRMLLCACDRRRRHVLFGRAAAENDMEAALLAQQRGMDDDTSAEEWSTDEEDGGAAATGASEAPEQEGSEGEGEEEGEASTAAPAEEPAGDDCSQLECLVCMSERIQVVCVPCGHACMCRKCSRRLRRCPLCRKEVTRRQKLFLSTSQGQ